MTEDLVVENLNNLLETNPQQARKVWFFLDSPDIDLLNDDTTFQEYFKRRETPQVHRGVMPKDTAKKAEIYAALSQNYT